MTTNIPSQTKDLLNRLMILEKCLELKSNECAYYRTKVHLMQMSSLNSQIINQTLNNKQRSSSEDVSHSSIVTQSKSIDNKHRTSSVPVSSQRKSILKKNVNIPHLGPFDQSKPFPVTSSTRRGYRKEKKVYAQNQNYYEEEDFPQLSSPINDQNSSKVDQILRSFINKHLQRVVAYNKNIQCNEKDFYPIETSHTVLMIRLPRRFIKSLVEKQNKSMTPKLKVQISSQLLNKLFQSIHYNSIKKFTIQSQFGTIAACINHKDSYDMQQSKVVHANVDIKTHRESRLPIIRHIARTRSDGSDRNKIITEKNLHIITHKHRRKKRHLHKSSSTSHEEIDSKRSSLTNVTQSIKTVSSSD